VKPDEVTIRINLPTLHSRRPAALTCDQDGVVALELPASFKQPRFDVDDLVHAAKTAQARRDLICNGRA
jgi:hypothetical protein